MDFYNSTLNEYIDILNVISDLSQEPTIIEDVSYREIDNTELLTNSNNITQE